MTTQEMINEYLSKGGNVTKCRTRGSKYSHPGKNGGSRYSVSPNKR